MRRYCIIDHDNDEKYKKFINHFTDVTEVDEFLIKNASITASAVRKAMYGSDCEDSWRAVVQYQKSYINLHRLGRLYEQP
jgi:hypothetical protein